MKAFMVIYGIDFSGAQDAGNKIWIAKGVPDGDRLLIKDCFRAKDLPNSGRGLEDCLPALVNLINSNRNAVFGFDFPFGLPQCLVQGKTWEEFVRRFTTRFHDPEHFKARCFADARNRERRRRTDDEAHPERSGQEEPKCEGHAPSESLISVCNW